MSFLTRCCGSRIFVHIAAATSALCRGTSQQDIAFQMFLQLQTLWRLVSRPCRGRRVSFSTDVAASQYVCSRGADNLTLRRLLASRCHWFLQVVAATAGAWLFIVSDCRLPHVFFSRRRVVLVVPPTSARCGLSRVHLHQVA